MLRIVSKWIFVALICWSPVAAEAQSQALTDADAQRMFIGVSTGLFDGLTTSYSTGIHAGWLGRPITRNTPVGGISPEVSLSIDYIRKVHLERLRHITDMIVREAYVATITAGARVGGSIGFRGLVGISGGGGRAESRCSGGIDWILLASVDNGKAVTTPAPQADGIVDPLCGKADRRFPFAAEIGPDFRYKRVRFTLPVVVTSYGDAGSRHQYSFKFGIDFEFGGFGIGR